jgi:hypothetical protein
VAERVRVGKLHQPGEGFGWFCFVLFVFILSGQPLRNFKQYRNLGVMELLP